jgi:hypothetical protein
MKLQLTQEARELSIGTNFSEPEKIMLKKAITAMHLQETQYYVESSNSYQIEWDNILCGLLTPEEKGTGFGFFLLSFRVWNEIIDLFDNVFNLPYPPAHLSRGNLSHRQTDEYKEYIDSYSKEREVLIKEYVDYWNEIKDSLTEPQGA